MGKTVLREAGMESLKLALQVGSGQMANPCGCSMLAAECWGGGDDTWGAFLISGLVCQSGSGGCDVGLGYWRLLKCKKTCWFLLNYSHGSCYVEMRL